MIPRDLPFKNGIPETVSELVQHIKRQCGVESHFSLQFIDAEFGNEFTNLTSVSEIPDKGTLKFCCFSCSLIPICTENSTCASVFRVT